MSRLLDRQRQIPNGFVFYEPSTKWKPPPWSSFDRVVTLLIAHRKGNPSLIEKNKWATEYDAVAEEVDQFNARVCEQLGWSNYIVQLSGAPPPPKSLSPLQRNELGAVAGRVKAIWAGVKTLNDWIDSGDPPVVHSIAVTRAATCVECTENQKGSFEEWFTVPASEAIRKQIERLENRNLSTSYDPDLNICKSCYCPLRLKVHTPLHYIKAHMSEETLKSLTTKPRLKTGPDPKPPLECWIVKEIKAS